MKEKKTIENKWLFLGVMLLATIFLFVTRDKDISIAYREYLSEGIMLVDKEKDSEYYDIIEDIIEENGLERNHTLKSLYYRIVSNEVIVIESSTYWFKLYLDDKRVINTEYGSMAG